MLAEGIDSLVDTGNQGLLLSGLRRAEKPTDDKFPFGHGKEVSFRSFVVAMLIFALGSGISLYEGVVHVLHPEPIATPMVNDLVLGYALAFEGEHGTSPFENSHGPKENGRLCKPFSAKKIQPFFGCCSRIPRRCSDFSWPSWNLVGTIDRNSLF